MTKFPSHLAAILLLSFSTTAIISGCLIRIESGTGDASSSAQETPSPEQPAAEPNDETLTPEELEVVQALQSADPEQPSMNPKNHGAFTGVDEAINN